MDEKELLEELDRFHEENRHKEIAQRIEALPEELRMCYEIRCRLGRAMNNLRRYQDAVDLLLEIREEGEKDSRWWSRMGYALYHLKREQEAAGYFRRALELNPGNADAKTFLAWMNQGPDGKENGWTGEVERTEDRRRSTSNAFASGAAVGRDRRREKANDWGSRGWEEDDEDEEE